MDVECETFYNGWVVSALIPIVSWEVGGGNRIWYIEASKRVSVRKGIRGHLERMENEHIQ